MGREREKERAHECEHPALLLKYLMSLVLFWSWLAEGPTLGTVAVIGGQVTNSGITLI